MSATSPRPHQPVARCRVISVSSLSVTQRSLRQAATGRMGIKLGYDPDRDNSLHTSEGRSESRPRPETHSNWGLTVIFQDVVHSRSSIAPRPTFPIARKTANVPKKSTAHM
jgi:hypothetical protein